MTARGRFYVLDGVDGCGKSTQAARLVAALGAGARLPPLHLREPGSTAAGERIRALLLDPEPALAPAAQVLLFAAATALTHLGIGKEMVLVAFGITLGGVVFAVALAFGRGGRNLARHILERRMRREAAPPPQERITHV